MAWDLLGNMRKSDREYFHVDLLMICPDLDTCCREPLTPFEMMKSIGNIDKKTETAVVKKVTIQPAKIKKSRF